MHPRARAILDFWFDDDVIAQRLWFRSTAEFDRRIRDAFLADYESARDGHYDEWREQAEDALALIVALDQFPRNLFRGSPLAFATDAKAQAVATQAVERGFDRQLTAAQRVFVYLPFEHAESLALQNRSLALFEGLPGPGVQNYVDFAKRHHALIRQFGRFPHRNAVLGRESTPAEQAYLSEHPNEFG